MEDQKPVAKIHPYRDPVTGAEYIQVSNIDQVISVLDRTTPEMIQRKREERASHTMRMASTWTMQY